MVASSPSNVSASACVLSKDGTRISYLSAGGGPSVLVIPGVLSMAADYAAFARALAERFTVRTHFGIERTALREVAKPISGYLLK